MVTETSPETSIFPAVDLEFYLRAFEREVFPEKCNETEADKKPIRYSFPELTVKLSDNNV